MNRNRIVSKVSFRWILVGSLVIVIALLVASTVNREATAAPTSVVVEKVVEWPTRELTKPWRWTKPGVKYEHMYNRADGGSGRLDWIRNNGNR